MKKKFPSLIGVNEIYYYPLRNWGGANLISPKERTIDVLGFASAWTFAWTCALIGNTKIRDVIFWNL